MASDKKTAKSKPARAAVSRPSLASRAQAGLAAWVPLSPNYLQQSRRPLVSLAFVLPLLGLYEGGVVWLGPAAMRNGADVWLRGLLDRLGFGQYFLLPVLTVGLLLGWHHLRRERWKLPREVVLGMYLESAALALVLMSLGYLQRSLSQLALASLPTGSMTSASISTGALLATAGPAAGPSATTVRLVGFCGAGIYEEVMFRLMLVPVVIWGAALLVRERERRVAIAVVLTSIAFSAAHYLGAQGEAFDWFSSSFRFLAGVFFAVLFVYRGFGIAAGTHALYDMLVGLA